MWKFIFKIHGEATNTADLLGAEDGLLILFKSGTVFAVPVGSVHIGNGPLNKRAPARIQVLPLNG